MASPLIFWDWFKENSADYISIASSGEQNSLLDTLHTKLHQFSPGIYATIEGSGNKRDLIITAEGDRMYFPNVKELVAAAPNLPEWNIVAFKPARTSHFTVDYNSVTLDPKRMWFEQIVDREQPDMLGIKILIPGFTADKTSDFFIATLVALDNLLGERSHAEDIHQLEIGSPPENTSDLQPIDELVDFIHEKKSR